MIDNNIFDDFASQYCFYLGKVDQRYDEFYTSYFEIIWDYKTYFESLIMSKINEEINSPESSISKSLKIFKTLPLNYQTKILNTFSKNVEKYEKLNLHDISVNICKEKGHQFENWEKRIRYTHKDIWINYQHFPNYEIKCEDWIRTCSICGFKEISNNPDEIKCKKKIKE